MDHLLCDTCHSFNLLCCLPLGFQLMIPHKCSLVCGSLKITPLTTRCHSSGDSTPPSGVRLAPILTIVPSPHSVAMRFLLGVFGFNVLPYQCTNVPIVYSLASREFSMVPSNGCRAESLIWVFHTFSSVKSLQVCPYISSLSIGVVKAAKSFMCIFAGIIFGGTFKGSVDAV